jgi:hypothetical protein
MKTAIVLIAIVAFAVTVVFLAIREKRSSDKHINDFPANESKEKRHNEKPV